MLFMVELRYLSEQRDAALRYIWEHGSTRYEGRAVIQSVWVASQDRIAYAVVESDDEDELEKACSPMKQFGTLSHRHVMNLEQL
jgi:hypothetical protein